MKKLLSVLSVLLLAVLFASCETEDIRTQEEIKKDQEQIDIYAKEGDPTDDGTVDDTDPDDDGEG